MLAAETGYIPIKPITLEEIHKLKSSWRKYYTGKSTNHMSHESLS